jgi:hypothetical protein
MRYYSTKRISGGLHFVCNQCLYKVAVSSFDPKDGDVRTQAATAVNQHAAANHSAVDSRIVEENSSNTQCGNSSTVLVGIRAERHNRDAL